MSWAGHTATQMGSLATALNIRGEKGDGVEVGWGLWLLELNSHHTPWDRHGLSLVLGCGLLGCEVLG